MTLRHHELCFGCGQQNLFGLQIELEPKEGGGVAGRFFVKQDHQGTPGFVHRGIIAAALDEAISLAAAPLRSVRLDIEFFAAAPIGTFVDVEASVEELQAVATASNSDGRFAAGRATLEPA